MLLLGWARPRASFIAITFSAVCGGGEMVPPRRCVTIDVFAVKQDESLKVALDGVRAFATPHDGVVVVHRAPDVSDADREQLRRIAARSGFDPAQPRACQCSRLAGASRLASTEPKRLADDRRRSSRDGRPLVLPVRVAATATYRPPQPPRSTCLFGGPADPATLGMPLFTVVVGLVDGFNPCAMWVLLLLRAVLANVRDRVGVAVTTLSRCRLQQSGGRWLTLISGVAFVGLGLRLLLTSQWLA